MQRVRTIDLIRAGVPLSGGQDSDTALDVMSGDDLAAELELIAERRAELTQQAVTTELVAELNALADRREALRGEQTRRAEEADRLAAERDAALARMDDPAEPEPKPDPADDENGEGGTGDGETPEPVVPATPQTETQPVQIAPAAPVVRAATVTRPVVPARHRARVSERETARIVTRGPEGTPGRTLTSFDEIGAEVASRRNLMRGDSPTGRQRVHVASIQLPVRDDRHLQGGEGAGDRNSDLIRNLATGPRALTAAGGWCAPLDPYYGQQVIASAARPVRDGLDGATADRGGVRYMPVVSLASVASAIDVWTNTTDTTPSLATKNCVTVACGSETAYYLYAVTRCLRFGNFGARAFPERVTSVLTTTAAAHAREGERLLLDAIDTGSTAITSAASYGAARDLIVDWIMAAVAYRDRERMLPSATMQIIAPAWLKAAMISDLIRGADPVSFERAEAFVDAAIRNANLTVIWSMEIDSSTGVTFAADAGGSTQDVFPTTVEWYIFAPGAWLFLDGGQLDLGIVRDSELNDTNDFENFAETFEGVVNVGFGSYAVTSTFCASGTYAPAGSAITC